MSITTLPPAPSTASPSDFSAKGDALLAALATFVTEANALETNVNAKEVLAVAAAAAAVIDAAAALVSKNAAAVSETNAGNSAVTASAQAAAALVSKNAAAVSETNSTNSANLAAANTLAQLTAVKTQTEAARDQAIAGLGAADQSVNLVLLSAGLQLALDIAGLGATAAAEATVSVSAANAAALVASDANVVNLEVIGSGLQAVLDFLAVVSTQINGGGVYPGAGSATEPSVSTPGDLNTGIYFPAADVVALVTAGLERLRVDANGRLGVGTTAPSGLLDVNDSKVRVRTAATPASAGAAGNAGEICWDSGFVYVCTATNTWKRSAIATW